MVIQISHNNLLSFLLPCSTATNTTIPAHNTTSHGCCENTGGGNGAGGGGRLAAVGMDQVPGDGAGLAMGLLAWVYLHDWLIGVMISKNDFHYIWRKRFGWKSKSFRVHVDGAMLGRDFVGDGRLTCAGDVGRVQRGAQQERTVFWPSATTASPSCISENYKSLWLEWNVTELPRQRSFSAQVVTCLAACNSPQDYMPRGKNKRTPILNVAHKGQLNSSSQTPSFMCTWNPRVAC